MQTNSTANTPINRRLWTVRDVAVAEGVKRGTVYKWVASGRITALRTPGGQLRFDPEKYRITETQLNKS